MGQVSFPNQTYLGFYDRNANIEHKHKERIMDYQEGITEYSAIEKLENRQQYGTCCRELLHVPVTDK
jgi:hypothetical protein